MNQLTVILVLALASTNASKFLQPLRRLQQELITRQMSDDPLYISSGYNDFLATHPRLTSDLNALEGWTSVTLPRSYTYTDLSESTFAKPDDTRIKRPDPSLSIVNALDVLRQQMMLEFARRKINESKAQIQRNRELLNKTGKRSQRYMEDPLHLGIHEYILRKQMQNENLGKNLASKGREDGATTRANQNELGYHM